MSSKIISYDQLPPFKDLFAPDFEDGKLYWKMTRSNRVRIGGEACYPRKHGVYFRWGIDLKEGSFYRANILYFLKYGIWPLEIDHINRNPCDDRIKNLREITRSKNNWNRIYHSKGLPPHIYYQDRPLPYYGRIAIYGKDHCIGSYLTVQEASFRVKQVEKKYYGKDFTVDYYLNIQQSSPEWHFLRQNRVTATMAYDLLNLNSVRKTLKKREKQKPFTGNYWTERGKLLESEARLLYQDLNKTKVYEVGGVINSKYPLAWYSPDGVVGLDGLIEIKAFSQKHHLSVIKSIDPKIMAQMQFGLFISERKWIDFIAYNPEIDDLNKAYYAKRIYPDPDIHSRFEEIFSR